MFDFLIDHASKNVWCTPDQDNQIIVKPARITPINGVLNRVRVLWDTLTLPVQNTRTHVFQVGGIHPKLLNLFGGIDQWNTIASSCEEGDNMVDVYHKNGLQYPRSQVWSMVTNGGNLLICIVKQTKITGIDFNSTDLYLRLYSNAYYESIRSSSLDDKVHVRGTTAKVVSDISSLQGYYQDKKLLSGETYAFVNGYKVDTFSLANVNLGDVMEVVHDSSIYRVEDFKLSELKTFDSTLDNAGKYVLHYPGEYQQTIDFYDDIDLYLRNTVTGLGVLVHKNAEDTLRMLTHRDYSIPVAYLQAYAQILKSPSGAINLEDLSLRLHIRKSGYYRPLIEENSRISSMYELDEIDTTACMTGVDSNVPVWNANNLESAGYPLLMRVKNQNITRQLVQDAYGYHGVSVIVADTPVKRDRTRSLQDIPVPYLLAYDATVSEYDSDGLMIGNYRHSNGFSYMPRNPNCEYAEMRSGLGSMVLDDNHSLIAPYDSEANYRFYVGEIETGQTKVTWTDVTGTSFYSISGNQIVWAPDAGNLVLARSDKRFLIQEFEKKLDDGLLIITLTQTKLVGQLLKNFTMEVPMGELDITMNKRSLIEGLDYVLQFPYIVVANREYLVNPETDAQKFTIRFAGFCDSDLKTTPSNEFGFVKHGKISMNGRYDLHDGRVQKVQCGGALYTRDELKFNEKTLTYEFNSTDNGRPYLIRDIVVPLRGLVNENTYTFRAKSLVIDKTISDYLTLKLPEAIEVEPNPISHRYSLFSPFICKIIYELKNGGIDNQLISVHHDDTLVRTLAAKYEYLLAYDPINIERNLDQQYVVIQPHCLNTIIDLNLAQYRYMRRIVALYANSRVNLATFIRLVE